MDAAACEMIKPLTWWLAMCKYMVRLALFSNTCVQLSKFSQPSLTIIWPSR